ncbi:porphobilinogen deaminase, dipyromethane cofactor binding domain-containing protein [Mycena metata]|uniref:hydroxymethylbilane synthase n=1 Tax=Mycena metata TaxID=1033252 RepID=A0AAD7I8B0_9AGAR|nr:porphobilinogen deaminase, dipyromethane cofactor binding domain-containing protein [Mycena metata]
MVSSPRTFTLASRASPLAQVQTKVVVATLEYLFPQSADSSPRFAAYFTTPPTLIDASYLTAGKDLWTKDLEVALGERRVDILVHCLKDVPTTLPEGFVIGGITEREDPVDSLIVKAGKPWKSLEELPAGSVVGTSSVRRVAQLRRKFPELKFRDVRGNLDTRLAKLDAPDGPYAAIVLAKAGMVRLGWADRLTVDIPPPTLYYAVAQGALGLEIRSDDLEAMELCEKLTHRPTQWKCLAERACLRVLEGGCSVPVGIESQLQLNVDSAAGELQLTGCVTSLDGQLHVEHTIKEIVGSAEEAEAVGVKLAQKLIEAGAGEILAVITKDRERRAAEAQGP